MDRGFQISDFKLFSDFNPTGDQPQAIDKLVEGINRGEKFQVLHGVTGSGKTYTLANVIERVNRPVLMIAHNKTLAAQLTSEYKEFFPHNSVDYFISYYDYYQPEAYLPTTDTYIEKDSSINDEIDRLRHKATFSLFNRRDVLIVASVSCIYGLGAPQAYLKGSFSLAIGQEISRDIFLDKLIGIRYERNDLNLTRGKFRVRGDMIEVFPAFEEHVIRFEFWGDELEKIYYVDSLTRDIKVAFDQYTIFPATHFVVSEGSNKTMCKAIKNDLEIRLEELRSQNKLLEVQRLEQRTKFDLEMIEEIGYCSGIENYSRYLTDRKPGEPPYTLMDYFPDDTIIVVDESHVTLPQIRGMYNGDRSRKNVLVDYGFRLPSALDNRPLNFSEFEKKIKQIIFVSATPADYELEHTPKQLVVDQVIRPTGLLDPNVIVRSTKGQMDNLLEEIKLRINEKERILVVTITKKMAEDLTNFLLSKGIKTRYLHSDIDALDRYEIIYDLRRGEFDVLVGVNLLREGLDLPEVSLIAILDADKEGFLRNERSLIQTIGRAARNVNGMVILYGDRMTKSMSRAIKETNKRRQIQEEYNKKNNIIPKTVNSKLKDNLRDKTAKKSAKQDLKWLKDIVKEELKPNDLLKLIDAMSKQMHQAAKELDFEKAAILRDKIRELGG